MTDAEEGESCRDIGVTEYHNETSGDGAAVSRQKEGRGSSIRGILWGLISGVKRVWKKIFSQRENNNERLLCTGHKRHVLGFMSSQTVTSYLLKTDRKLESEVFRLFKENSNLTYCLRTNCGSVLILHLFTTKVVSSLKKRLTKLSKQGSFTWYSPPKYLFFSLFHSLIVMNGWLKWPWPDCWCEFKLELKPGIKMPGYLFLFIPLSISFIMTLLYSLLLSSSSRVHQFK